MQMDWTIINKPKKSIFFHCELPEIIDSSKYFCNTITKIQHANQVHFHQVVGMHKCINDASFVRRWRYWQAVHVLPVQLVDTFIGNLVRCGQCIPLDREFNVHYGTTYLANMFLSANLLIIFVRMSVKTPKAILKIYFLQIYDVNFF